MTGSELAELAKAAGLPGVLIAAFIWLASKLDLSRREDPSRDDVLNEIKALRKENADENRAIRKEIDSLSKEVTDRLARVETTVSSHSRKLDR